MSKAGCLSRIDLYKKHNNTALLEQEELFWAKNYKEESEEPKEEKKEKVKKNKD
jgi:hypothetical protein